MFSFFKFFFFSRLAWANTGAALLFDWLFFSWQHGKYSGVVTCYVYWKVSKSYICLHGCFCNYGLGITLPWTPGTGVMSRHIEKSWDFKKRFRRIEFTEKVLKIQEKELHHVKIDKICYWRHLFWTLLLFLVMEISSWKNR